MAGSPKTRHFWGKIWKVRGQTVQYIFFVPDENVLDSGDKHSSRVLAHRPAQQVGVHDITDPACVIKNGNQNQPFLLFAWRVQKPFVSCTIVYEENTWARSDVQVGKTPEFCQAVDFYCRCKKKKCKIRPRSEFLAELNIFL
jgi:hypothetical protein